MRPWYAILPALLLGGCGLTAQNIANDDMSRGGTDQGTASSGAADATPPVTNIATARVLWKKSQLASYSFTQQRQCYCRQEYTQPIDVVVRDGEIASATYRASGNPVSAGVRKSVRTIEGWLDYIATRQLNDPYAFDAVFDPQQGYPIRYSLDQRENVADDTEEVTFRFFSTLP